MPDFSIFLIQLLHLVGRVVHVAQLLLDRFHLLVQVVLALTLLHLPLHSAPNALFDLEKVNFLLQQIDDVLQPTRDVGDLEDFLLLLDLHRQVSGNGIGESPRLVDVGERGKNLGRDLLVELYVLLELGKQRARQRLRLALVARVALDRRGIRGQILRLVGEAVDTQPAPTLDQHLDRAVGQLEELENGRNRAYPIDIVGSGLVLGCILLSHQENLLVHLHCAIQGANRPAAANEEGNDHVRVHDDVA